MSQREPPGNPALQAVRQEAFRRPSRSGSNKARKLPLSANEGGSFSLWQVLYGAGGWPVCGRL